MELRQVSGYMSGFNRPRSVFTPISFAHETTQPFTIHLPHEEWTKLPLDKPVGQITYDQWHQFFSVETSLDATSANTAAEMMIKMGEGVNDAFTYHRIDRNLTNFEYPKFAFSKGGRNLWFSANDNTIYLSLPYLLWQAKTYDRAKKMHYSEDLQVAYIGDGKGKMYINAAEECDHAAYFYEDPDAFNIPVRSHRLAEIDADPIEMRALETCIELAKRKHLWGGVYALRNRKRKALQLAKIHPQNKAA